MSLALSIFRLISDFSKVITLLSLNFKIIPILQIVAFCSVLFFFVVAACFPHLSPKEGASCSTSGAKGEKGERGLPGPPGPTSMSLSSVLKHYICSAPH